MIICRILTLILTSFGMFSGVISTTPTFAQFDTIINVPPDDYPASGVNTSRTQLNLFSGDLPNFYHIGTPLGSNENIELNVFGGAVGNNLEARPHTVINISDGAIGNQLRAWPDSFVNISGGSIGDNFRVQEDSNVTISGGSIGNTFLVNPGANVTVTGGSIGANWHIPENANVTFDGGTVGDDFQIEQQANIAISNGTFGDRVVVEENANVLISGGTFGDDCIVGTEQCRIEGGVFGAGLAITVDLTIFGGEFSTVTAEQKLQFHDGEIASKLTALATTEIHGGTIACMDTIGSQAKIFGGTVQGLSLLQGATNSILGGAVDGEIVNGDGINRSRLRIKDGNVSGTIETQANSLTRLDGGTISGNLTVDSDGCLTLLGGQLSGNLVAVADANIRIFANQLQLLDIDTGSVIQDLTSDLQNLNPGESIEIAQRDVTLDGVLHDGSTFSYDLYSNQEPDRDYVNPQSVVRVTFENSIQIAQPALDSFYAFRGNHIGGDLPELLESDDQYLSYNPGYLISNLEDPVWLIFETTFPESNGVDIVFTIESKCLTPGIGRQIEISGPDFPFYEQLEDHIQDSPFVDAVSVYELPSPLTRHLDGDQLKMRVGWRVIGFTINFPWQVDIDQVEFSGQFETIPEGDPIDACHRW